MAKSHEPADRYELLIGGEYTEASSGETLQTIDPATEATITTVAAAGEADVDRAVTDAKEAQPDWEGRSNVERGRILSSIAREIRDRKDRLAELETLDNGKPISQAESDVLRCARYFEYYAGVADKIQGETIPLSDEYLDYTRREPLGVTGHIIPWNFPVGIMGREVAPALATGNTAVVKPAEQTPVSTLEIAELALEAGLPPGVLNVVPGFGPAAGEPLARHPSVDGLSFTGSVKTGRTVARAAMEQITPIHLELGGKNPNVIFPDADLENAVENAVRAIFSRNAGQACSSGSRALVHEDIHDEFLERLVRRAEDLAIGPGLEDPDVGPITYDGQFDKIREYLKIGREEAGEPLIGGEPLDRTGYFVPPTIFDGVESDMRIAQEEIFGPVLSVLTFSTEAEAISLANDVKYGLVAGIFTSDVERAHRFARDVDAGGIYVNEWYAGGVETPFGGFKQSGFGRSKGLEALTEYTHVKNVCAKLDRSSE